MYRRFLLLNMLLCSTWASIDASHSDDSNVVTQDNYDCGPRCVSYICNYMGITTSLKYAYKLCGFQEGDKSTKLLAIKKALQSKGLYCLGFKAPLKYIYKPEFNDCCFVVWQPVQEEGHFTVFAKSKKYDLWLRMDPTLKSAFPLEKHNSLLDTQATLLAVSRRPIVINKRTTNFKLIAILTSLGVVVLLSAYILYKRKQAS